MPAATATPRLREGVADPCAGDEDEDAVGPRPVAMAMAMEARPAAVVVVVAGETVDGVVVVGVDVAAAHPLDERA